jgi:CBS domain-containing protein
MEERTHAVRVDDDQEDAAQQLARYDVVALPVVDDEGRLVGIITHDDAMDVLTQEATEDFHKVGTVGTLPVNVRDATISLLYRKRVSWLVLLVFANIFSGAGIAYFEDTIAAHMALLFFLPLLIASAGNAGAQASTLMVRALATGDVVMKDWGRMLGREALVATALGVTMAFAVSGIGLVRGGTRYCPGGGADHGGGGAHRQPCRHVAAVPVQPHQHGPGHRQRPWLSSPRRMLTGRQLPHRRTGTRWRSARRPAVRRAKASSSSATAGSMAGGWYSASACFHSALAFCQASGRPSAAHCW